MRWRVVSDCEQVTGCMSVGSARDFGLLMVVYGVLEGNTQYTTQNALNTTYPSCTPQSGAWGYINSHNYEDVVEMEAMDYYVHDTFGLRTLDETGRLVIMTPANVSHAAWIHDQATVETYVLPQLD